MRRIEAVVNTKLKVRLEFNKENKLGEGGVWFVVQDVTSTYEDGSTSVETIYYKEDSREYQTMGRHYVELKNAASMGRSYDRLIKEDGFVSANTILG